MFYFPFFLFLFSLFLFWHFFFLFSKFSFILAKFITFKPIYFLKRYLYNYSSFFVVQIFGYKDLCFLVLFSVSCIPKQGLIQTSLSSRIQVSFYLLPKMSSPRKDTYSAKDLKNLKKDDLVRMILKIQNENLQNVLHAVTGREESPSANPSSSSWLLLKIKEAVVEAVKEIKEDLENDYQRKLESVEEKFTTKLNILESEVESLKMEMKSSVSKVGQEVLHDIRESTERKNNIMVFGLQESDKTSESGRREDDVLLLKSLSSKLGVPNLKINNIFHLGRPATESTRPRPLKITCECSQQRADILRSAFRIPKLGSYLGFGKVFIKQDLTPKEQEIDRLLRHELKRRREAGERAVIRDGRILVLSASPQERN